MRLLGMVEALKAQEQDPSARELSFLERFGLSVDQQWNWREIGHGAPRVIRLEESSPGRGGNGRDITAGRCAHVATCR